MYLFIDTETTGLPYNFNSLDSYRSVRLVQIAWIVYDITGKKLSKRDFIVKPDGFEIPGSSSKIHKITTSFAISSGKSLNKVLVELNSAIREAKYIVAHNLKFDINVLQSEFNRIKLSTTLSSLTKICTMEMTADYCGIITSKGNKWPSLSELYKKIFNDDIMEAHNASVDIEATAKCFWYLKKNKLIDFEKKPIQPVLETETKSNFKVDDILTKFLSTLSEKEERPKIIKTKSKNMNLKEYAISLKSYCESIKDGDSVSKKQIEKLFQMVEELIILINEGDIDDDFPLIPETKEDKRTTYLDAADDLPF